MNITIRLFIYFPSQKQRFVLLKALCCRRKSHGHVPRWWPDVSAPVSSVSVEDRVTMLLLLLLTIVGVASGYSGQVRHVGRV